MTVFVSTEARTPISPPRTALKVVDTNRIPSASHDDSASFLAKNKNVAPMSTDIIQDDTEEEFILSDSLPVTESPTDHVSDPPPSASSTEVEEAFRLVCVHRCSEELDEEDVEEGDILQPWSMDDFEVLHKLGSGAAGTVYQARERQSQHPVALKVQKTEEEALCEMDMHIDLEHSGIVKMIDYFYTTTDIEEFHDLDDINQQEDGDDDSDDDNVSPKEYLVFILELCHQSLFDTIRNQPERYIPESQAASMFYNVFDAMDYLHSQDIIHCDIKSLNFLVNNDSNGSHQLKLADFGMAVRGEAREVVGGSCMYMSPEHLLAWRQCNDEFDHRSDIYSLGVVLYETLVGYLPYQVVQNDQDFEDLLEDGLAGEPILDLRQLDDCNVEEPIYVPPPIFPDFISDEAKDLIERLIESRPDDRITLKEARQHPWFRSQRA
jgi:serine/threonine protein kinase